MYFHPYFPTIAKQPPDEWDGFSKTPMIQYRIFMQYFDGVTVSQEYSEDCLTDAVDLEEW